MTWRRIAGRGVTWRDVAWRSVAAILLCFATSMADAQTLYVVRRGWHTDVGFATTELSSSLEWVAAQFPGVRYIFFSFGDRHYLLTQGHGMPAMLGALWPGRGLILVTALSAAPAAAFGAGQVIRVAVSPRQAAAAQRFVANSVTGAAALPGPYAGSAYLTALARYSAVHTCNTWVAEVMNAAGLPVRPEGVIFAGQVWRRARRVAE